MRTKRTRWIPAEFDRYDIDNYSAPEVLALGQAHLDHLKKAAEGRMRRYRAAKQATPTDTRLR